MYKIIANNPFRILGVCANSSLKDIIANKGKMNAFLKVGKAIAFPLDMPNVLGEINRTIEIITAADTQLTIESDKLRAAQLWFLNIDDIDKTAFAEIKAGNFNKALGIWEQSITLSSLQNRAVVYMVLDNIEQATEMLSRVYDTFLNDFVNAIGINHSVTHQELVDYIVLTILRQKPDIAFETIAGTHSAATWREAAKQPFAQVMTQKLNSAVEKCKKNKYNHYLEQGRQLLDFATPIIANLIELLTDKDAQLVNISDKVGKEIMDCAMAHHRVIGTEKSAQEACQLLRATSTIILGTFTKHLIYEKLGTLNPQQETVEKVVDDEEARINNELENQMKTRSTLQEASFFVDSVWNDIVVLGQKRGTDDATYISLSSRIALAALNKINDDIEYRNRTINTSTTIYDIKYALRKAIEIIERIWQLDIDDETREKLQRNYTLYTDSYNKVLATINSSNGDSENNNCGCVVIKLIIGIIALMKLIHIIFNL